MVFAKNRNAVPRSNPRKLYHELRYERDATIE